MFFLVFSYGKLVRQRRREHVPFRIIVVNVFVKRYKPAFKSAYFLKGFETVAFAVQNILKGNYVLIGFFSYIRKLLRYIVYKGVPVFPFYSGHGQKHYISKPFVVYIISRKGAEFFLRFLRYQDSVLLILY